MVFHMNTSVDLKKNQFNGIYMFLYLDYQLLPFLSYLIIISIFIIIVFQQ